MTPDVLTEDEASFPHGASAFEYPVVNAMRLGGEALVFEFRSTVADDDIAIGSVADRWFRGSTDIPFQGRQDRF